MQDITSRDNRLIRLALSLKQKNTGMKSISSWPKACALSVTPWQMAYAAASAS